MSACSTQNWVWRQGLSRSPRLDIAPPRSRVSQPERAMRCSFQATSQASDPGDIYTRQPRRLVTYFAPQRSIVLLRKFSFTNNTVCGGRLVSTLTFISRERQYTNINRQQSIAPGAVRRYVPRRWQFDTKSRRIYVHPRTCPQSSHLCGPALAKLHAANVPIPQQLRHGTDRRAIPKCPSRAGDITNKIQNIRFKKQVFLCLYQSL